MAETIAELGDEIEVSTPDAIAKKELGQRELIVPPELVAERTESFVRIIGLFVSWNAEQQRFVKNPKAPKVDRFIVPYRSGPIAIAGFEELLTRLDIRDLFPQITYVHGVGNEILYAFFNDPANKDLDSEFDISDYNDELEDKQYFMEWVRNQPPDSQIGRFIAELRNIIKTGEKVALLDDTYSLGITSGGVFPAMKNAAFGDEVRYAIQHNQNIFPKNTGWIKGILRSTYGASLSQEKMDELLVYAKGGTDSLSAQNQDSQSEYDLHVKLMDKMRSLSTECEDEVKEKLKGDPPVATATGGSD